MPKYFAQVAQVVQRALHTFVQQLIAKQAAAHQPKAEDADEEEGAREAATPTAGRSVGAAGPAGDAALGDPDDDGGQQEEQGQQQAAGAQDHQGLGIFPVGIDVEGRLRAKPPESEVEVGHPVGPAQQPVGKVLAAAAAHLENM